MSISHNTPNVAYYAMALDLLIGKGFQTYFRAIDSILNVSLIENNFESYQVID